MISDYRLDPFTGQINIHEITGEVHIIPENSPYTIRLNEVPQKTDPSTLRVEYQDGGALTEVSAQPAAGQYWPDYLTTAHDIEDWNTGTLLFNAADAGKTVVISYNGIGTLADERLADMMELTVTGSSQANLNPGVSFFVSKGYGSVSVIALRAETGIQGGTYTLAGLLQELVGKSHTHSDVTVSAVDNCADSDCGA